MTDDAPPKRKNSRNKGKRGELELSQFLRDHGYNARRGQQFHGGGDSPDVVCPDLPIHIECKRVEAGPLYSWLEQANNDAPAGKAPVVMHRKNGKDWVAILSLEDFLNLFLLKGL